MTHNGHLYVAVEKHPVRLHTYIVGSKKFLGYHIRAGESGSHWSYKTHEIPVGSKIVGLASELSEEEAQEIAQVDIGTLGGKLWKNHDKKSPWRCETAIASINSLLTSHNMQPDSTVVIKID